MLNSKVSESGSHLEDARALFARSDWISRRKEQRTLGFLLCLFVSQMSEVQHANNKASATVTTAVIILCKDRWFCPTAIITLIKSDAL